MSTQKHITPDRWGKDHWSLLAYIESLCVDGVKGIGTIQNTRMSYNPSRHPLKNATPGGWMQSYGTRLKGFFEFPNRNNPTEAGRAGVQLPNHDDWDSLEDLEAAGLIEVISMPNGSVKMLDAGLDLTSKLRKHKAAGGMYATFSI